MLALYSAVHTRSLQKKIILDRRKSGKRACPLKKKKSCLEIVILGSFFALSPLLPRPQGGSKQILFLDDDDPLCKRASSPRFQPSTQKKYLFFKKKWEKFWRKDGFFSPSFSSETWLAKVKGNPIVLLYTKAKGRGEGKIGKKRPKRVFLPLGDSRKKEEKEKNVWTFFRKNKTKKISLGTKKWKTRFFFSSTTGDGRFFWKSVWMDKKKVRCFCMLERFATLHPG